MQSTGSALHSRVITNRREFALLTRGYYGINTGIAHFGPISLDPGDSVEVVLTTNMSLHAVVNVSSIGALTGSPGRFIHYAGSKGAVDSMTLGIASEVVRDGIRVNAVRPGMVDTPIHAKTGQADRMKDAALKTPLGRAGRPEEVAESIVWLLSDKASLVTGAILNVMGAQR